MLILHGMAQHLLICKSGSVDELQAQQREPGSEAQQNEVEC